MTTIEDVNRHRDEYRNRERWTSRIKIAGILMIIISAFGIVGAIDMQAELASERVTSNEKRAAAARELERGLRGCPPAGPGMTNVVVMVVRYESDIVPVVEYCMRFAERSYLPRRAR